MSYTQLISDLEKSLSNEGTGVELVDLQKHANDFSDAINNYVKILKDPGNRVPLLTNKLLIYSQIILISPGTSNLDASASASALKYATGLNSYISAIQIQGQGTTVLNLLTPFLNPGTVITGTLTNSNSIPSIQSDFKSIFNGDIPENILKNFTASALIKYKAIQIADLVKKCVVNNTTITISGNDSTIPPTGPKPFTLTGKFTE